MVAHEAWGSDYYTYSFRGTLGSEEWGEGRPSTGQTLSTLKEGGFPGERYFKKRNHKDRKAQIWELTRQVSLTRGYRRCV